MRFERAVAAWVSDSLASPPTGLDGWWASESLFFFSTQRGLAAGAVSSALLSIAGAALAVLLMTLNWLVALLAAVAVVAIVLTEVGALIAAGWQLGIVESVVLSVAVGMSVDFVSHVSHGYVFAHHGERDRTRHGATRHDERRARAASALGAHGVAFTSAALSTAAVGAIMTLSVTVFYFKFGVLLLVVMAISWSYVLLLLLPLLYHFGPTGDVGDLRQSLRSLNFALSTPP